MNSPSAMVFSFSRKELAWELSLTLMYYKNTMNYSVLTIPQMYFRD